MSDIQPLINYLNNAKKADRTDGSEIIPVEVVDQNYRISKTLFENTTIDIKRSEIGSRRNYTKLKQWTKIRGLSKVYINILDTLGNPNSIEYYEAGKQYSGEPLKFRKINKKDNLWIILDESTLQKITLPILDGCYYSPFENRIIHCFILDVPIIYATDVFTFIKSEIDIDNGNYELNYVDHEGYNNEFADQAIKLLIDPWWKNIKDRLDRKVEVQLMDKSGDVNLLPIIKDGFDYVLKYIYPQKTISLFELDIFTFPAVRLKFESIFGMLEFLNQTVFTIFNNSEILKGNEARQDFFNQYTIVAKNELSKRLRRGNIEEVLTLLHYVPNMFLETLEPKTLWKVVGVTLEHNLTNIGLNREDIVLKLLSVLSEISKTNTDFLKNILNKQTKDKSSYFSKLYNKLNGDNFNKYVSFVQGIWLNSEFSDPSNTIYKYNQESENSLSISNSLNPGPLVVNYWSEKTIGFYYNNMETDWVNNETLRFKPDNSWWDEIISAIVPGGQLLKPLIEAEKAFHYHPFQPIGILNAEDSETILKMKGKIFPAFILKAEDDKQFWSNVEVAAEYALDIITTFSGVGNLAKFRYMYKFASKAGTLRFVSKAGKVTAAAKSIVQGTVATVEISSGSVNILLKLTGINDTNLGRSISEMLFYLELLSLSGELTTAIHSGIKKSAKNLTDPKSKKKLESALENNMDNKILKEDIKNAFKELEKIAESEVLRKNRLLDINKKIKAVLKETIKKNDIVYATLDFGISPLAVKLLKVIYLVSKKGLFKIEDFVKALKHSNVKILQKDAEEIYLMYQQLMIRKGKIKNSKWTDDEIIDKVLSGEYSINPITGRLNKVSKGRSPLFQKKFRESGFFHFNSKNPNYTIPKEFEEFFDMEHIIPFEIPINSNIEKDYWHIREFLDEIGFDIWSVDNSLPLPNFKFKKVKNNINLKYFDKSTIHGNPTDQHLKYVFEKITYSANDFNLNKITKLEAIERLNISISEITQELIEGNTSITKPYKLKDRIKHF